MGTFKLVIDATDVRNIMGTTERTAQRYLKKIKEHFGKESSHCVTVDEFCEYSGIPIEKVHEYFRGGGG